VDSPNPSSLLEKTKHVSGILGSVGSVIFMGVLAYGSYQKSSASTEMTIRQLQNDVAALQRDRATTEKVQSLTDELRDFKNETRTTLGEILKELRNR
jgi:hypothetical protein